ncbi:FAR1-related sequence 5-like protein [Tanacetum coccineum]
MDCALSILSSMQLPINNGDNQAVTSDATVVEPDAQTIDVDQQQMVKTLGIVRLTDDGVKFYKLDVSDSVKPLKGKLKDGKVKQKYFVYSREGFKPIALMDTLVDNFEKLEIKKAKRKRKRPSGRCGCLARVIFDIIAVRITFKMMKELFGSSDEVGATSIDCKNFRRGINLFIGEYDAEMVVELLMNKQEYKMFFVPFNGIDNHRRSVTLATALLSNETAESYGSNNEDSCRKGVLQFKTSILYVEPHLEKMYIY